MVAVMSDIGLKGVAGFVMLLAAGAVGVVALIAGFAGALFGDRRHLTFAQALLRYTGGPLVTVLICLGAVASAWDGPSDLVDEIGPFVAVGSLVLGIVVMLVPRFTAVTKPR
jgi:hypothetical protein